MTGARRQTMGSVRRLVGVPLALLIALVVVAIASALGEVGRLQRASRAAAALDATTHVLEAFSSAMRDAYAHQAHVVILGDMSHVDHYRERYVAAEHALVDVDAAFARAADTGVLDDAAARDSRADAELLSRALHAFDTSFRDDVLPLIRRGAPAALVAGAHEKAVMLVDSAQITNHRMTTRLELRAAAVRAEVEQARDRLLGRSGIVLVLAVVLAVAVAFFIDRRVSRPLRTLADAAARVGAGARGVVVDIDGGADELQTLAARFNDMTRELVQREENLLAAERLASLGRVAAGVAHEVNNPLAVMLGYVRLIEKNSTDDAVRADARLTLTEIARVQAIVRGLLDLAKPPRVHAVDVDVVAVVVDVAAPFGDRVVVGGVAVAVACVDEGKLTQIVRNLVQNAIDASNGGVVVIDVAVDAGYVDVVVRDHGAGFSAAARARAFEPFFTEKAHGTGLGLAVSERLARAHGGSLTVLDNAPDGGARVRLRVPVRVDGDTVDGVNVAVNVDGARAGGEKREQA